MKKTSQHPKPFDFDTFILIMATLGTGISLPVIFTYMNYGIIGPVIGFILVALVIIVFAFILTRYLSKYFS